MYVHVPAAWISLGIFSLIGFLSITYFSVNYLIGKNKGPRLTGIKQLFNQNQKEFIFC